MRVRRGFRTSGIGFFVVLLTVGSALCLGQITSSFPSSQAEKSDTSKVAPGAQVDSQPSTSESITVAVPDIPHAAVPTASAPARRVVHLLDCLSPPLSDPTITWIAVTVILVLTLQTRPFFSWRNLDGFVLALTALAFPLRNMNVQIADDPTGRSLQWWSYLLLSIGAGYWLIRGMLMVRARSLQVFEPNVAGSAKMVLIIAVLYVALSQIMTAPLAAGSRDGLIGGSQLCARGTLPYGDIVEHDSRSPLLYALHAGACKLMGPVYAPTTIVENPNSLPSQQLLATGEDLQAARLVNAFLFVLTFLGLGILGHQLHSATVGLTLAALFAIFPGVIDSLAHPDVMLPAMLITWSLIFANVRVIGGLLAMLCSMAAGFGWPWAWLLALVLFVYLLRRRWQWPGAVIGLAAGIAGALVLLTQFVAPAPPSFPGALSAAGAAPRFTATARDGMLVIAESPTTAAASASWSRWIWSALLNCDEVTLATCAPEIPPLELPQSTPAANIRIRDIVATDAATAAQLQRAYRAAARREPGPTRLCLAVRTVLESTWLAGPESPVQAKSPWELWAGADDLQPALWTNLRRGVKLVTVLVALGAALMIIGSSRVRPHQLIGAFAAVSAAALLAGQSGAVLHWVLLAPAALAVIATGRAEQLPREPDSKITPDPDDVRATPFSVGPRITVEK